MFQNTYLRVIGSFLIASLFTPLNTSFAFKIKTHVYVGKMVWDSLNHCTRDNYKKACIDLILPNGKTLRASVKEDVAKAILLNQKTYLVGQYGPDAFPGLVSGQVVIHPGIEDKHGNHFGTGDWINHLMEKSKTPEELAFTYGFAGHAAADTFAHTYVNMYAGDIFSLTDGEIESELRHNLVEALIAKYTPDIAPTTYQFMNKDLEKIIPENFIYQTFYHDGLSRDLFKSSSFSQHLVLLESLYKRYTEALKKKDMGKVKFNLKRMYELIFETKDSYTFNDFVADYENELKGAGLVQKIEIYIMKMVATYTFGIRLRANEAEEVLKVVRKLHALSQSPNEKFAKEINRLSDRLSSIENKANRKGHALIKNILRSNKLIQYSTVVPENLRKEKKRIENKISKLESEAISLDYKICTNACNPLKYDIKLSCHSRSPSNLIDEGIRIFQKLPNPIPDNINVPCKLAKEKYRTCSHGCDIKKNTLKRVTSSIQALKSDLYYLEAKIHKEINKQILKSFESLRKATDEAIVFNQNIINVKNQFNKFLTLSWTEFNGNLRETVEAQQADVILAINKFTLANAQAMTNSMNTEWWQEGNIKDVNSSVLEPYRQWLKCYGPTLVTPIPFSIADNTCKTIDRFKDTLETLKKSEEKLKGLIKIDGKSILSLEEILKEQGRLVVLKNLNPALEKLKDFLGLDSRNPSPLSIHNGLSFDGDDYTADKEFKTSQYDSDELFLLFTEGQDGKGLLSDRLKFDMNLQDGQTYFSPFSYPVVANAIQLAKLALLDAQALNKIAEDLGYNGGKLYHKNSNNNILTHWLFSIDGNHQWAKVSPYYVRRKTNIQMLQQWLCAHSNVGNDTYPYRVTKNQNCFDFIYGLIPEMKPTLPKNSIGMPWFSTEELRENVFNKLFKGPMSPGLFDTGEYFPNVIPSEYREIYNPDNSDPFPVPARNQK